MADVCLLMISPGEVRLETCMSLVVAAQAQTPKCDIIGYPSGPYLDCGRNTLQAIALENSDAPVFLWVDADVGFTIDDIVKVCDGIDDYPITCGWYNSVLADKGYSPVLYDWAERKFTPIDAERVTAVSKRKAHQRVEVDACGAGFLAIHRDVILEMGHTYKSPMPWFDEPIMSQAKLGEDFGFCLRARQLGYPIWVRPDVHVDHYKTMKL